MSGRGETAAGGHSLAASVREPFEITGNPWLDGVIFARGARKNNHHVTVKLGDLPLAACEQVEQHALRAGFQAEYDELYNAVTRKTELVLSLVHEDPLFETLPRFRERTVPEAIPVPFLEGYFLSSTQIAPSLDGWGNPMTDAGVAMIHPWRGDGDLSDVFAALERLGVREMAEHKKKIRVPPHGYEGVAVFDQLRQWTLDEEAQMLSQSDGKSYYEAVADRMIAQEGTPGVPVACLVIDRRMHMESLLIEQQKRTKPGRDRVAPVMLVDDPRDKSARDTFWDYQALLPPNPKNTRGEVPLNRNIGIELVLWYDAIIHRAWPFSREYRELCRMADVILEGKAHHYGKALPEAEADGFFPEPRPRGSLVRFFVHMVRPGWFDARAGGKIRLKPLEKIKGKAKGSSHSNQVRKHLGQLDPEQILEALGTLSFSPHGLPPGSELLRHCTSCDGRIVLFDGVCCSDCGTALCIDCAPESGKPLCSIHRSPRKEGTVEIPKKKGRRAGASAGGTTGGNNKPVEMKEIKVIVTKDQYLGLHAKKVVSGKTLTDMVGEALKEYLKKG